MASKVNRLSGLIRSHGWRLSLGPAGVDTLHLTDPNTEYSNTAGRHNTALHQANAPRPSLANVTVIITVWSSQSLGPSLTSSLYYCLALVITVVATSLSLNSTSCSHFCTNVNSSQLILWRLGRSSHRHWDPSFCFYVFSSFHFIYITSSLTTVSMSISFTDVNFFFYSFLTQCNLYPFQNKSLLTTLLHRESLLTKGFFVVRDLQDRIVDNAVTCTAS